MTQFDTIYNKLVENILNNGTFIKDNVRTVYADGSPATYYSLIGYQFRYDNSTDEPPVLTTRYSPWKSSIRELYWIWIMQSNNVDELNKLKCKFWDSWKMADGTIGKAYGYQIGKKTFGYKSQLDYVIEELKKNPNSRRIMTEIWIPEELDEMALSPCVHLTQWSVINGKLYLEVRQRSCDVALGLVANVFQYSLLHKLVAMECGLEPAEIIWNIHNAHLYNRHIEDIKKQINSETYNCNPKIKIDFSSIYDFKPEDVRIDDYPMGDMPKYKYEVAI